jgi:malonyl CoA-acyl carrier protein transacylase
VETKPGYSYQIPLSVVLPPANVLSNLLVPVCVSSSHVAYSTLRMEPQFMIMGHSTGVVAALSIQTGATVQNIDTAVLHSLLLADNQTLSRNTRERGEEIDLLVW